MEKAPPLVLLGGADAHDLVLVEMLIDDYPNIIFVVLTSLNPIIPLGPNKVDNFDTIGIETIGLILFVKMLDLQGLSDLWQIGLVSL